jgi:hypothetical protein
VACSLEAVDWGVALILLLLHESLAAGISALGWLVFFALAIALLRHRRPLIDH